MLNPLLAAARRLGLVVYARIGDKLAERGRWNDLFQNRKPSTSARKPAVVDVKNATGEEAEILLYSEIGWYGVTATEFVTALNAVTAPTVRVRINSPGGDVFDGLAIYNALQQFKGTVICQVDGLAASAASFIMLAGSKTIAAENAIVMCHCAWTIGFGNASDMQEVAKILGKIDAQLAGIYAKKTGKSVEDCAAMMAGEGKSDGTWFTAAEAKEFGLVDEVTGATEEDEEDKAEGDTSAMARVSAMRRRLALAELDV